MIKQDTINEILNTAKIEEVVGDYVALKKKGANYLGLCPFHNEKTPSFTVSPAKGIFKCFGCGEAGNSVGFIMKHEHLSYPEALKYLADKYQIEVEETEQTAEEKQKQSKRESLYIVNDFANKWFQHQLHNTNEGKAIALTYFKERGFTDDIIKKFQLGYSPDGKSKLTDAALAKGYQLEFLTETGLTIHKPTANYDRFHGRVMFPIHNISGKVIGFGGRILKKNDKAAKYLNSPESEIYHKSKIVYGIYFAKSTITKQDNCYLVEGYTDVISLYQKGIQNVVASSGTSLTEDQIKLIKRYTNNITILYDGDPAGIKASFRGIDMILSENMNVKVLLFPEGEDPDSFAQQHTTQELQEFLQKNTTDFLQFKINLLKTEIGNDPIKKVELLNDIANSIAQIPDAIKRSVYTQQCATLMEIPEQAMINEINKKIRAKLKNKLNKQEREDLAAAEKYTPITQNIPENTPITAQRKQHWEREIARLLCRYGNELTLMEIENEDGKKETYKVPAAEIIIAELKNDGITLANPLYAKILSFFETKITNGKIPDIQEIINGPDQEFAKHIIDLIAEPYELSKNWEKHNIFVTTEKLVLKKGILQTIKYFKLEYLQELIDEKRNQLKAPDLSDDKMMTLLQEIKNFETIKKELADDLGITILN